MMPFKGSLSFPGKVVYMDLFSNLFGKRNTDFPVQIWKQQNLPKQQNLSSNEIPTENLLGLFPEKESHIGCLSRKSLPLKDSILLEDLIGTNFLEMPV